MTDREGDPTKRPPECKTSGRPTDCPHLRDVTPRSMDRETYECDMCGQRFVLYYEDMA
jgi:hypothetical protein